jgi:hypothetical protein
LAQSPEARVRSALIPLLLRHPEFGLEARVAASRLEGQAVFTLELFYTAAMLLQKKYAQRLERLLGAQAALPDLFGESLGVELSDDVEDSLARVGQRNAELSGLAMNWTGGYEHAARSWLEYIEWRQELRRQHTWQASSRGDRSLCNGVRQARPRLSD